MPFKLLSVILGTLLVITVLRCVSGECQNNCQWTEWGPWECSHCCGRSAPPEFAFMRRGICCHNTTNPNECIQLCGENKLLALMRRPCPQHCQCPTTTTLPSLISTGITPVTLTRTRVSTADVTSISPSTLSQIENNSIDSTSQASNGSPSAETTVKLSVTGQGQVTSTMEPVTTTITVTRGTAVTAAPTPSNPGIPTTAFSELTTWSTIVNQNVQTPSVSSPTSAPGPVFVGAQPHTVSPGLVPVPGHAPAPQTLATNSLPPGAPLPNTPSVTTSNVVSLPTGINGILGTGIPPPDSIGTILNSGFSSLNNVISSSMAHTGSNETLDCRQECSGKVEWDDCLLECFLRPCTTMLTFVSPCLFILGVIVGSSLTCIIRKLLNKKKKENGDKNAVMPFG